MSRSVFLLSTFLALLGFLILRLSATFQILKGYSVIYIIIIGRLHDVLIVKF